MFVLVLVASYLLGSLSSAILVSRAMGLADPRSIGSGNPGATNVLRSGSKKAAILTLVGDVLKGFIPVLITTSLTQDPWLIAASILGAQLGHLFPVFFRFQGGKGVATALGVLLASAPSIALIAAMLWLAVAMTTRYSSLAALTACIAAPLLIFLRFGDNALALVFAIVATLVVVRHHANILRLWRGEESRIQFKRK